MFEQVRLSLAALAQRCELRFGLEKLSELFQDTFWDKLDAPPSPLFAALARQVRPGVHVTLLWFSALERALAAAHPDMTIYGIQPSIRDSAGKPRIVKRARGASAWTRESGLPKSFDFKTDIVVVRVYGGYLPEPRPIFTGAMLTEDDHLNGLISASGFRPPAWAEELVGRMRLQPALFVSLSVLEWRHRMLLRWLFDHKPAPPGSLTILDPSAGKPEQEIWTKRGGGLPGKGSVGVIREDDLRRALRAMKPRAAL